MKYGPGTILGEALGREEECRANILATLKELTKSTKATKVRQTYRELEGATIKARRAPRVIHPREVDSPYLLSGIIHCARCGAAMVGHRGGCRYRYYMCSNTRRKGREVCPSPVLRKDKVEEFVIDRIKGYILTEENLEDLQR